MLSVDAAEPDLEVQVRAGGIAGLADATDRLALPDSAVAYDTLDLCRRFFKRHSYTLANVCRELHLTSPPSHRAMDDVRTLRRFLILES